MNHFESISAGASPEKLGMIAKFGMIVRGWRCGCRQLAAWLQTLPGSKRACDPRRFQDAAFIKDDRAEGPLVQLGEAFIVRHHDARADFVLFADLLRVDAEFLPPRTICPATASGSGSETACRFLRRTGGEFQLDE